MADLHHAIAAEAERTAFSGVVRVDRGAETLVAQAFGLADRGREVPNTVGTRFALASGAKGFTALVVMFLWRTAASRSTRPRARSSVTICR